MFWRGRGDGSGAAVARWSFFTAQRGSPVVCALTTEALRDVEQRGHSVTKIFGGKSWLKNLNSQPRGCCFCQSFSAINNGSEHGVGAEAYSQGRGTSAAPP